MATVNLSIERDEDSSISIHDVPEETEIKIERKKGYRLIRLGDFQVVFFDKEPPCTPT